MMELTVGDVTITDNENGTVTITNNGEVVGTVTAAGLVDAARVDDDTLSKVGAEAYGNEQ